MFNKTLKKYLLTVHLEGKRHKNLLAVGNKSGDMFPIPFCLPWAKQHLPSYLTVLQGSAHGAERRHPLNLWLLQLFNHFFGFPSLPPQSLLGR